jgi:prevent-host-death family protein
MKIASIAEVKANLSAYVKASEEELVVITRNGKPVAVLLPMGDEEELERLALAYSKRFQAILTEARHQITTTGGIPHTDFWREMGCEQVDSDTSSAASRHKRSRPNHGMVCPDKSSSADRCKSGRGNCQEAT